MVTHGLDTFLGASCLLVVCFLFCVSCRWSAVLLLSMHRASSENMRGVAGSGLRRHQHHGGAAERVRCPNCLSTAARFRPRSRNHRGGDSRCSSEPRLHLTEDHHAAQRNARPHGVPYFCYQTKNLKLGVRGISLEQSL